MASTAPGQVVGDSAVGAGVYATEWSGGDVINLGGLPGSISSFANGINDAGQVVGYSLFPDGAIVATEWSHGSIINLGGLPGTMFSQALSINDAGQAVGFSEGNGAIPESSTWAMMLIGLAGLGVVAWRGSRKTAARHALPSDDKGRLSGRPFA